MNKDTIKGVFLLAKWLLDCVVYGRDVKYTSLWNTKAFISNRPFGSRWLTKRSDMWIVRTRRGVRMLRESSSKLWLDDSLIKMCDAKPVTLK